MTSGISRDDHGGTMASFLHGLALVFTSVRMLRNDRRLMIYFLIPFALNIILLSCFLWFLWMVVEPFMYMYFTTWTSMLHDLNLPAPMPFIIPFLPKLVVPILLIILSLITIFIYSITGSVIIAPFNDIISRHVEEKITGEKFEEAFSAAQFFRDIVRVLANIIRLIFLMILVNILLLLLNIIPFAGSVLYLVLSFITMAFFFGFQFFDFPLERRRIPFHDKLAICFRHRGYVTGVGTGFYLAAHIPVLGFLTLNTAAIAATIIFTETMRPRLAAESEKNRTGNYR